MERTREEESKESIHWHHTQPHFHFPPKIQYVNKPEHMATATAGNTAWKYCTRNQSMGKDKQISRRVLFFTMNSIFLHLSKENENRKLKNGKTQVWFSVVMWLDHVMYINSRAMCQEHGSVYMRILLDYSGGRVVMVAWWPGLMRNSPKHLICDQSSLY